MAIVRDNSQQTTANISVLADDGSKKTVASATCHVRPNRGMTFAVDLLEGVSLSGASYTDVSGAVSAYMAEEINKAASLGIPIALPAANP